MPGLFWYLIGCIWGSIVTWYLLNEDRSQGNEHNSNWHWYSRNHNDDYCYRTHNSIWNICCLFHT